MSTECIKLAEKLDKDLVNTLIFLENLTAEEWELQIYSEGTRWNPEKILAHFITAELGIIKLMKNILGGGEGVKEDFDIDEFNEREVATVQHIARRDLIDQFINTRSATVDFVSNMNDEDLIKNGRHPFLGVAPIEKMVKLIYRHNQIHLREVRKIMAKS